MSEPQNSSVLLIAIDFYKPQRLELSYLCTGPLRADAKQQAFILRQQADQLDPPSPRDKRPTFHLPE